MIDFMIVNNNNNMKMQDVSAVDSIWQGHWACYFLGMNGDHVALITNNTIEWNESKKATNNNNNENAATMTMDDRIVDFASTQQAAIGLTVRGTMLISNTTEESQHIEWHRMHASCGLICIVHCSLFVVVVE